MVRAMETQAEYNQRVHANLESMSPWMEKLDEHEREHIVKQVNSYAMPLINRLLALVKSGIAMSNGNDSKVVDSRIAAAQNIKFESVNGKFFGALERYNDKRVAPLYEMIDRKPSKKTVSFSYSLLCQLADLEDAPFSSSSYAE